MAQYTINGKTYTEEQLQAFADERGIKIEDYKTELTKKFGEDFSTDLANVETNAGSIEDTVSQSEDISSDSLLKAKETIANIQFSEEELATAEAEAAEVYDTASQGGFDNQIDRDQEGGILTDQMLDEDSSSTRIALATMFGDAYSSFKKVTDRITPVKDNVTNVLKGVSAVFSNPIMSGLATIGSGLINTLEEETESNVVEGMKLVERQDIEDFKLYNQSNENFASKELRKTKDTVTQKDKDEYIENNKSNADFIQGAKDLFIKNSVKLAQSKDIAAKYRKEGRAFLKSKEQIKGSKDARLIQDNLTDEAKENIGASKQLQKDITSIDNEIRGLSSIRPNNQEDLDVLKNEAARLLKKREGLVNAYGEIVNDQIDIGDRAEDINAFLDANDRNQGFIVNPLGSLAKGAYDFTDGIDEVLDRVSYKPWEIASDFIQGKLGNEGYKEGDWIYDVAVKLESFYEDNGGLKTAVNNMQKNLQTPISISDIDGYGDMWQWSSNLVGSQAMNTAVMLTTGGWALPLLGASSAGASFNSMQEEIDLFGAEYTPLQMYTVAFGTGLAEALSERITLGQLKRIKGGLAKNKLSLSGGVNKYLKTLFTEQGAKNAAAGGFVYAKETFEEGFTESVAGFSQRSLERYVLGKDVNLFDGMLDEFVSGAFMSGFVYKAPGLGIKMYRAFQPPGSNQQIGQLQDSIAKFAKLRDAAPTADGKRHFEDKIQESATKIQQIMAKDFKNMDKMTQQEQTDLMVKEDKIYALRKLYDQVVQDNSINAKDKQDLLDSYNASYNQLNNEKTKILSEVNVREEITNVKKLAESAGNQDFGPDAVGTGLAVEVVEDGNALTELTKITDSNVEGVELDNGQIVLNKAEMLRVAMANGGNIGTGTHELLHKVLKSEFSKDPVKAQKLKEQFLKVLKSEDKNIYDAVIAKADANYSPEYLLKNPDEYLTIFSSILKENNIKYSQAKDGIFKRIANYLGGLIATKADIDPNDYTFKDGKDAYNFVQDFVKNTSEGKLSDRAKKLAEAGKDIKSGDRLSLNKVDSAKVNDLYETQGDASLLDVVDLMKPTAKGLAQRFRSRPKFAELNDILEDEILSGKRGIMEVAMGYPAYVKSQEAKGEKVAPLSGYLNNSFSTETGFKRYIEIADRVLGKDEQSQFTQELTEAADTVDTEVTEEKLIKAKPKPKLRKDLKLQDDVIDKIKSAVIKTFGTKLPSVKSPKFKQELEKQFRTELKPVIAKMMGRTDSYESFLRDNFEAIYKALPQEIINKRFRDFASPVMKDGKPVREKTAQGNAMFTKKKITKAEFIKYFLGSNVGRSTQGTRKTALAEALSQELALDATMEVIQNPGVLEKAIAISQLVDGDFTVDGVSLNIKRPKGVKFARNAIGKFNNTIAGQLTLVNAFQSGAFNTADLKQYNNQVKNYDVLLKDLVPPVPPFDMKTEKGRKAFKDYAYTSGLITKLPKAFWRTMQGKTQTAVEEGQNVSSNRKSESDSGYQIAIEELNDEGKALETVRYDVDTSDGSTLRDFAGNLPFRSVTEIDTWINEIENGQYKIDGVIQPAVSFASDNSISPNIMAALSGTKYTDMKVNKKQSFEEISKKSFQAEQDKSIQGLKEIFLIFEQAMKDDVNAAAFVAAVLSSSSSNQGHFIRTAAPIRFFTNNLEVSSIKGVSKIRFVEEHSLPASGVAKYLFGLAVNGTVETNFKGVKNNYYQGALNKVDDNKLKGTTLNGEKFNYGAIMPLGWVINDQTWARYFNINVGNTDGGIDPASIIWHDGKSIAEKTGVNSFGFILKGENKKQAPEVKANNGRMSRSIPVDGSISKQLNIISNIDKTMKFARSIDTPEKGISVFDFDDTLAKTNSKVVVTMPESVQSVTNTGDAKKVINTVYKSVINSVANNSNINTISFSSEFSEKSRVKLYNSLANKLSKDLGWELEVFETVDSTGNTDVVTSEDFTLTKGKDAKKIKGDKSAIKFKKDVADNLKSSFNINGKTYDVSLDFRGEGDYSLEFSLRGKSKGKTYKINATEFAEQSADLEAQGAKFNFDEFSKVVDGKKGPLADLALKRQGKFGSKNIFVLTARPQLAAEAIKKFLDGIGLSLPLANITGLENGSPQAKADWVLSKTAEGYNDFYFADDAIKNVKAVKNILDQVDVKSDVQLAKFSKSKDLNTEFNKIIEDATGIADYKTYSNARARTIGRNKTSGWFIPPQAEDFVGLLYSLLGKGKTGDAGMKFFKDRLLDPFNKAESSLTQAKISISNDFKALKKQFKNIPKTLKKEAFDGFTYADAVRVYIWSQQGMEMPGLSKRDVSELIEFIKNDDQLRQFAQGLQMIQKDRVYPEPGESWLAGTITTDIIGGIDTVVRADYLQEWQENIDIIFSNDNLNKLEAAYGENYREALENIIARMKSGSNRQASSSRVVNEITDWLNNSVGAIMFFNTRSAMLQTISAINFINYGDNNILKAGLAFANQPQYWKDFNRLFNSEYLVARRNGLKINVNESEIADAVKDAKNKPKAAIAYLLKKGFLPTQIADSFAIASGGATFYRNRIKTYLKQGLTQQEAETKAFEDFYAISEETQQSSRTDRISQEQSSIAGRVILAFANTPQQYARKSKKDFLDLINGRGGPGAWKGQIGRIIYYQGAQNLLFNALQNALFAMMFDEDEDEITDKKAIRIANGMADSTLRGLGIYGAAAATFKNILLKLYTEREKKSPKYEDAALEMLSFSPPLDSKLSKFRSALRTFSWNSDEIAEKGFSLDNPALMAGSQVLSAFTNIPLDRVVRKYNNLDRAFQKDTETWESTAMILGWSEWEIMGPPAKKEKKKKTKKRKRKF